MKSQKYPNTTSLRGKGKFLFKEDCKLLNVEKNDRIIK